MYVFGKPGPDSRVLSDHLSFLRTERTDPELQDLLHFGKFEHPTSHAGVTVGGAFVLVSEIRVSIHLNHHNRPGPTREQALQDSVGQAVLAAQDSQKFAGLEDLGDSRGDLVDSGRRLRGENHFLKSMDAVKQGWFTIELTIVKFELGTRLQNGPRTKRGAAAVADRGFHGTRQKAHLSQGQVELGSIEKGWSVFLAGNHPLIGLATVQEHF